MPRKKSAKTAAKRFIDQTTALIGFAQSVDASDLSARGRTWAYEAGLIKLAVAFETLMLEALVCATNNDTGQMSATLGVWFPKRLTDEVCEYIVTGGRYFDFKGRDGLLGTIKGFVGDEHYLYVLVKHHRYKSTLEQLIALRNFAAHESSSSKRAALTALGRAYLSSAGSHLKTQDRFTSLAQSLATLAGEIETVAPY
jgi:hypothetical protein